MTMHVHCKLLELFFIYHCARCIQRTHIKISILTMLSDSGCAWRALDLDCHDHGTMGWPLSSDGQDCSTHAKKYLWWLYVHIVRVAM
jgi:hypothetical protein